MHTTLEMYYQNGISYILDLYGLKFVGFFDNLEGCANYYLIYKSDKSASFYLRFAEGVDTLNTNINLHLHELVEHFTIFISSCQNIEIEKFSLKIGDSSNVTIHPSCKYGIGEVSIFLERQYLLSTDASLQLFNTTNLTKNNNQRMVFSIIFNLASLFSLRIPLLHLFSYFSKYIDMWNSYLLSVSQDRLKHSNNFMEVSVGDVIAAEQFEKLVVAAIDMMQGIERNHLIEEGWLRYLIEETIKLQHSYFRLKNDTNEKTSNVEIAHNLIHMNNNRLKIDIANEAMLAKVTSAVISRLLSR